MREVTGYAENGLKLWEAVEVQTGTAGHRVWFSTSAGSPGLVRHYDIRSMVSFHLLHGSETYEVKVSGSRESVYPQSVQVRTVAELVTEKITKLLEEK